MDWLGNFASMNANAMIVVLAIITLVIGLIAVVILAIKKGWVSFSKSRGLYIGGAESESKIRSMQQVYAKSLLESTISDLPKECEYYRARFVISQCLDEVERMIRENHISSDECYIETEFQVIYNIIIINTDLEYFRSEEFKRYLRELLTKLIKQLESIRKTYAA